MWHIVRLRHRVSEGSRSLYSYSVDFPQNPESTHLYFSAYTFIRLMLSYSWLQLFSSQPNTHQQQQQLQQHPAQTLSWRGVIVECVQVRPPSLEQQHRLRPATGTLSVWCSEHSIRQTVCTNCCSVFDLLLTMEGLLKLDLFFVVLHQGCSFMSRCD